LPATRLPFQHHVFTVIATVVLASPEGDSDLHVVLHGQTGVAPNAIELQPILRFRCLRP
jgi:hypothetical protein